MVSWTSKAKKKKKKWQSAHKTPPSLRADSKTVEKSVFFFVREIITMPSSGGSQLKLVSSRNEADITRSSGTKVFFSLPLPPLKVCSFIWGQNGKNKTKKNLHFCILNEQLYLGTQETARPLVNLNYIIISYTQFLIHGHDNVRVFQTTSTGVICLQSLGWTDFKVNFISSWRGGMREGFTHFQSLLLNAV